MLLPAYTTSVLTHYDITPAAIVRTWERPAWVSLVLLPQEESWGPPSPEDVRQLIHEGMMTVGTLAILPVDPEADRLMAEWIAEQPTPAPRKALSRKRK
ncbi:MAG TPA: hypothetical protein VLQ93_21730 [Myxococcaceae bacterium]|nr:hypothetical protein [Myxococcaceae bacterium]